MLMPGMLFMPCFAGTRRLRVTLLFFGAGFCLTFDLAFVELMPGMLRMSWPWALALLLYASVRPVMMTALNPEIRTKALKRDLFIVHLLSCLVKEDSRERAIRHTSAPRKVTKGFPEKGLNPEDIY